MSLTNITGMLDQQHKAQLWLNLESLQPCLVTVGCCPIMQNQHETKQSEAACNTFFGSNWHPNFNLSHWVEVE